MLCPYGFWLSYCADGCLPVRFIISRHQCCRPSRGIFQVDADLFLGTGNNNAVHIRVGSGEGHQKIIRKLFPVLAGGWFYAHPAVAGHIRPGAVPVFAHRHELAFQRKMVDLILGLKTVVTQVACHFRYHYQVTAPSRPSQRWACRIPTSCAKTGSAFYSKPSGDAAMSALLEGPIATGENWRPEVPPSKPITITTLSFS